MPNSQSEPPGALVLNMLSGVFKNPVYVASSVVVFLIVLAFSIWLPNISFIRHTSVSTTLSTTQKLGILSASLGALNTNFTPVSRFLTIAVSLLFSVNFSAAVYYFKKKIALEKTIGTSFVGVVAGFLGVGCASCGSVVLTSILGLSATVSFISILPLKGAEFGLISIGILLYSLYLLSQKINNPLFCKTNIKK